MQTIPLEPGMRVRCVNAGWHFDLEPNAEYVVDRMPDDIRVRLVGHSQSYYASRFKPIIRVKAPCVPSLSVMLARAVKAVAAMPPAEREAMHRAQRQSWSRQDMD